MDYRKPFPKIISHQGLRVNGVTNTIPAFMAAATAKTDMIEMDVHETRDGYFIIHHDFLLDPDTPPWRRLTYPQVLYRTGRDDRAPKLSETIDAIGPLPVDLEIKSCRNVTNLARELSDRTPWSGSVVSSSNYDLLKQLHTAGVPLPLFLVISLHHSETRWQNIRNAALCVAPFALPKFLSGVAIHYKLALKATIKVLQNKGAGVLVWTVDNPEQMKKFILLGVDGIITNDLRRLQALKNRAVLYRRGPV